jgi:serine/threonine protein kinase
MNDATRTQAFGRARMLGPYRLEVRVGEGGMGEVFRATDTRLQRTVAIKLLRGHDSSDSISRERFLREAQAASLLNHPNICTLYDVGESEGQPFLVMEYLEGETLREKLERGPLPIDEILELSAQIADALDAAHTNGIVHRDIKPANIFVTRRGRAKVMDFGIAKRMGLDAGGTTQTSAMPAAFDRTGRGGGNRRLHVARTGARRAARSPYRSVLVGRGSVRDDGR